MSDEDRSWMYQRLDSRGRLIDAYRAGVQRFLDFAYAETRSRIRSGNNIRCPCKMHFNSEYLPREKVGMDLYKYGFVLDYLVWKYHGEDDDDFEQNHHDFGDSSSTYAEMEVNFNEFAGREMVIDAFNPHFREPEMPNSEAKAFYDLLLQADEKIYDGSDKSVLEWISGFLYSKVKNNVTDRGADDFLEHSRSLLQPENREKIPDSMYNLKKMMGALGLAHTTYDVCVNDCFLFYKDGDKLMRCPVCNEDRYIHNEQTGNISSRKKLWYFPIIPRLQRLFMLNKTAEHMTWHENCKGDENEGDNDTIIHPAAAEAWKHFDRTHPTFAAEPRNVRLGLCTDGFTPFSHNAVPYSCWPVFITPYNLPPELCMDPSVIFLNMLISGPTSPGKNIDVMLRPLIDELKLLWNEGVETYDCFKQQNFLMRAALLWTISDFPAYGMLSGWSTHGKFCCPCCMERSKAFRLKHGKKTSFFDCHRQFLPKDHPFRRNKKDFIHNRIENGSCPERRTGEELLHIVHQLPDVKFGIHYEKIPEFGVNHNWTKKSIFWELPYWSTLLVRHTLDPMHCEKNFVENTKNTVMDDPQKSKDNIKARKDLELHTRRKKLFLKNMGDGRVVKPKAPYALDREQRRDVCQWLKDLRFSDGYASNSSQWVNMSELKLSKMKSHDCHVFMQRLLPIAFRDFLPDNIWGALTEVSNFFRALCATEVKASDMRALESSIVETICKLEKFFPPAFFDSMEHLVIHLPYEVRVCGPVQYHWMYPFERRMFHLKRSVRNKRHVEARICREYLYSEITHFCSPYLGPNIESRFNRLFRNEVTLEPAIEGELSIFAPTGRPIGRVERVRPLSKEEYYAAYLYVLLNCEEVEEWLGEFDDRMGNLSSRELQHKRKTEFIPWFKQAILSGEYEVKKELMALAHGPSRTAKIYKGYLVNGFRFHTEAYGKKKKTMNSGVCCKATTDESDASCFYGMLQEVIELQFWGSSQPLSIFLFKCDWYDITKGMDVHPRHKLVSINSRSRLSTSEPFIIASQASQVYYCPYPSARLISRRRGWWAVCHVKARNRIDTSSISIKVQEDGRSEVYQDNSRPPTQTLEEEAEFSIEDDIESNPAGDVLLEDDIESDDSDGADSALNDTEEDSDNDLDGNFDGTFPIDSDSE